MKSGWWFRFVSFMVILVGAIALIIPTVTKMNTQTSSYPIKSKVNLGLDLQGGLYMVLGIDFNKLYRDEIRNSARKTAEYLTKEGMPAQVGSEDFSVVTDPKIAIVLSDASLLSKAKDKLLESFGYTLRFAGEKDSSLIIGLSQTYITEVEKNSLDKSIEVIRNRIDEFGVTEPEIISQGNDRIVVQLPGIKDAAKAKELIGKTAKLEFKLVNDEFSGAKLNELLEKAKASNIVYKTGDKYSSYVQQINDFLKADLPEGYEVAFEKIVTRQTNETSIGNAYLVEAVASLTGDELQDARISMDSQMNRPYVSMEFKPAGATKFESLTADNVGKRMAIVLDKNVYSAPAINEKIAGGRAQITLGNGNYNDVLSEAKDLALVLRAGALPVELEFQEQRIIGPSLGGDSIDKAVLASIVGVLVLFLWTIYYYRVSGIIAVVLLMVDVVLVLAALVSFGATLTLPGIAGIALTVGMAVDASIVIYERIKEELATGASAILSVQMGFEKAFWSILDANLTTAFAGICLMNFGTGPIRGFAVTLLIGIAATVYTGYFVAKMFFEYYMYKVNGRKISI